MNIEIDVAGCTNTCRHCSAGGHLPYGDFFTLEELRTIKKEWGPLVIRHEPTAYSDFPAVFDESIAVDHGGWLVTNGFGLARRKNYEDVINQLQQMGIHTVAFTLHGLQEHHDWFVCRVGAFDDILLATRRAKAAGFRLNWQIFVDRKGITDIPALVEMAIQECDAVLQLGIPSHRVGGRLSHFEEIRPTLKDILKWKIHELCDDPRKNRISNPEALTMAAWLEKWEQDAHAEAFKHPYEPRSWPPQADYKMLTLLVRKDRKVFLDPMCSSPVYIGHLSDGKEILLDRITSIERPEHVDFTPNRVSALQKESQRLHPYGMSVRYRTISLANLEKRKQNGRIQS